MTQSTDYEQKDELWEAMKPRNKREWIRWILSIFCSACLVISVVVVTTAWREGWDSAREVCQVLTGRDIMANGTNTVVIQPKYPYTANLTKNLSDYFPNVTGNESPP